MNKNAAEQRAQNWGSASPASSARPRIPRLLAIIGLALLAWGVVIALGMLGWSVVSGMLG